MVILDGVSKVFGNGPKAVPAVDNVSLTINRGEIFAIIGYSGAGKSTLVRLINGLEKTTSGTLIVDDFEISGKRLRTARGPHEHRHDFPAVQPHELPHRAR